jgi:hypothetical protein
MSQENCANNPICYVPVPYSMGYKHLNVYVTDYGRLKHLRQNEIEISDVIDNIKVESVSENINKDNWIDTRLHKTYYTYQINNQLSYFYFEIPEYDHTKEYKPGDLCYINDNQIYQSLTENINSDPETNPSDWLNTNEIALKVVADNQPYDVSIEIPEISIKDNVRTLILTPVTNINYGMNITKRDDFLSKSVNLNNYYYIITIDSSSTDYYTIVPDFNAEEPVKAIPIIDIDQYQTDENIEYMQFYKELDENTIQWYKAQFNSELHKYIPIASDLVSETEGENVYVNYRLDQDVDPIMLLSKTINTNGKINFIVNVSEEIYSPATVIYYLTDKEKNKLLIDYNGKTYNYIHKNVINTINKNNILTTQEFFNTINSNIIRLKHKIINNDVFEMVVNNKKIEKVTSFNSNNHQCIIKNDIIYTNFNINYGDNVYFKYEYYIDEVCLEVIISVNSKVNKTISPEINNINLEFLDD